MLYFITLCFLFVIFKVFFRLEVKGKENIPSKGAFILASNHSSYLDPPILAVGCFQRRLNFLAKEELFYSRIFSWYIRKLNAFPIKRGMSDIGAIKECIGIIRKGQPLVIFPEGERSEDGELKEGLPGVALLATKTKIPIIPAFIKGADRSLSPYSKSIKLSKIYLSFGKPLIFYKQGPQTYSEITNKIMSSIKELSRSF